MAALPRDTSVAVIGAGAMGAGIAQVAALAGHRVLLFDTRMGAADDARDKLVSTLAMLRDKGKLDATAAAAAGERIVAVHALGDCVSTGLVVEAIVEDLAAKRKLIAELDVIVSEATILATNTSSLSITALAAGSRHPARVVGMHFFNPVPLMPLVEVVRGLATADDVATTVFDTARAWGKTPVYARSTPGFIVNRCARPFYAEALRLLGERAVDPATLDAVMREAGGFRMGPCELMDLVGHDVNFAVTSSVYAAMFDDPRYRPSVIQREMVAGGRLGRKSGQGFYRYGEGAPAPVPATEAAVPAPASVAAHGDLGPAAALAARIGAVAATESTPPSGLGAAGALAIGDAWLVMGDGRTATARAAAAGVRDVVVFDLALDYATCRRIAVARADTCSDAGYAAAVGALQAGGFAVSRLDDVAGLAVLRTVAMLANEAADAAVEGIATAADIDIAMQKGVNYPRGPLAWADALGARFLCTVLANLAAHYGEDRYRLSPLIARRAQAGMPLVESR
ncbi:MAG: 3-hydroxyacyl-CoA dehydrogenase [Proteobacteria bacterium]|nr:3-hydroxyacyl-CoA dehydrogenase [Pseudomonadota bacterium]